MPSPAREPGTSGGDERAAGIGRLAHDLANALAAASARSSVLANQDLPPDVVAELRAVLADIGRARDILRELAQLSNADERRPVDLLELWRKVAAPLSGSRVRVEVDSSGAVPAALANPGQTERILSSVVAAEVASNQRAGSDVVVRVGAEVEGERVVLTVRSSAPPYSLEARKRILNPFFLRNPEALGEGMGFAVCSRIAQTQGGSFALDGRDGTREYRLELPKVAGAVASTSGGAARPGAEAGSGLRVLLVDDDDRVRQSCILMLRHLGHTVVSVSSGEEAVERILAERFDALLLDLHLGNGAIDGRDVLLEIEQRHSAILGRTFLATGDPTSGTVRELVRTLGVQVLAKPFGVEELRAALASLR